MLAYGLRDIVNSWSDGVMKMQIAEQQVRSALGDQLVTQDAKDAISQQAQKCMQMPQPSVTLPSPERPPADPDNPLPIQQEQAYQYLECLEKLGAFAEKKKEDALKDVCFGLPGVKNVCAFFTRFMDKTINSIKEVYKNEADRYTIGSFITKAAPSEILGGLVMSASYTPIFSFTQWLWTNFLELAMWLSALFAPILIAASIIPGRQNLFVTWLIGFLTIGMAKLAYVIVIGVVAAQLSSQTTYLASDIRFPMALGLFAPGVSLAVVTSGGIAAAMSFRSQSVAVVSAGASVITSAVATIGYSVARYSDKRR